MPWRNSRNKETFENSRRRFGWIVLAVRWISWYLFQISQLSWTRRCILEKSDKNIFADKHRGDFFLNHVEKVEIVFSAKNSLGKWIDFFHAADDVNMGQLHVGIFLIFLWYWLFVSHIQWFSWFFTTFTAKLLITFSTPTDWLKREVDQAHPRVGRFY